MITVVGVKKFPARCGEKGIQSLVHHPSVKVVMVHVSSGNEAVKALSSIGALRSDRFIERRENDLFIPVHEEMVENIAELGYDAIDIEDTKGRETRIPPFERILDKVDLPDELLVLLPDKWEILGDLLLVNFPSELEEHAEVLAPVYTEATGTSRMVVIKESKSTAVVYISKILILHSIQCNVPNQEIGLF